jgi:hypothetical protein
MNTSIGEAAALGHSTLCVDAVWGDIGAVHEERVVEAVVVGHYMGVRPQASELALDRVISAHLPPVGRPTTAEDAQLLLTSYTQRGTLRGALGEPFFLPDPRDARRTIVVMGLGEPGRFGAAELSVIAREMCWAVCQLGIRRVATVVIGAGEGNLDVRQAVAAWLIGLYAAVTEMPPEGRRVESLTFVETDARKLRALDRALRSSSPEFKGGITYRPVPESIWDEAHKRAREEALAEFDAQWAGNTRLAHQDAPTRITVGQTGRKYRFGAITATAAVPEREIPLDPRVVEAANDELAGERDRERRLQRGQFLGRLLLPEDLRPRLAGDAPVVLLLDSSTARIHWELVTEDPAGPGAGKGEHLGLKRGLTRQLRTTFAPPPEPPPPPQRVLRVLVVADPAEKEPLENAADEGKEVVKLFRNFGRRAPAGVRVEVVPLIGPDHATITEVLSHLMLERFHILHFAGHCQFAAGEPEHTGWVFGDGQFLTADELTRIDRVPEFVFSNACESGVTLDRSSERTAELAPSFAESFFSRGVGNFVCTAWPVDDSAAKKFAITLYKGLLGTHTRQGNPLSMHEAMKLARQAIAGTSKGARSWGAYQHYGDPYYRMLA